MKKIKFTCPHCAAKLRVPTHLAGVSAPCPKCGATITAPSDITAAEVETSVPARAAAPSQASGPAASSSPTAREVGAPAGQSASTGSQGATTSSPAAPSAVVEPPAQVAPPTAPAPAAVTPPAAASPTAAPSRADEAPILVEERYEAVAPARTPAAPPLTITQPIQITRPTDALPMAKEAAPSGDPLPRLDVSLAGQEPAAGLPSPLAEPTRTRVYLPPPGATETPSRPEDFLSPAATARSKEGTETPAPPAEEVPQFETFEELAQGELPAVSNEVAAPALPPDLAPISLDDLAGPSELDPSAPSLSPPSAAGRPDPVPETSPVVAPATPPSPQAEVDPLDSFAALFAEASESEATPSAPAAPVPASSQPSGAAQSTFSEANLPEEEVELEELPASPLEQGSFGKLLAQSATETSPSSATPPPVPQEPVAPAIPPSPPEDSFGALLAEELAPNKINKRVLLLLGGAVLTVVILLVVGIIVGVNYFGGGWDPAEDYAQAEAAEKKKVAMPRIPTSSETAKTPPLTEEEKASLVDAPAISRDEAARPAPGDAPALAFDEKASQAVNGSRGTSVIGSPSLDLIDPSLDGIGSLSGRPSPQEPATPAPPASNDAPTPAVGSSSSSAEAERTAAVGSPSAPPPGAEEAEGKSATPLAKTDPNYNPPDSFPAPGPEDRSALGHTHDVIDAFLRAPDVATRVKYTFNGESLRPAIEDYHQKWPYQRFGRYSLQLYDIEMDSSRGGPYWVFIVSTSDDDAGFPLIVRNEGGLLKVDWEIFAEFSDRHFLRFRDGAVSPPATFRLIIERFSDYYGSDRDAFTDLADYYIFQVNPPYGDINQFAEYVFVKRDSPVAKALSDLIGLGDDPLAVVVTLDQKPFAHGVKHIVITELVTEGWFR